MLTGHASPHHPSPLPQTLEWMWSCHNHIAKYVVLRTNFTAHGTCPVSLLTVASTRLWAEERTCIQNARNNRAPSLLRPSVAGVYTGRLDKYERYSQDR